MKYIGIFFGRNAEQSKCVALTPELSSREKNGYLELAKTEGTRCFFYLCSEKQEVGSTKLK